MTLDERYEQLRTELSVNPYAEVEYPPIAVSYGTYKSKEDTYPTPIGT
jgi:hypothetical protein